MEVKERKGYWVETLPNGERLFCFRTRINGQKVVNKFTLKEIEAKLTPLPKENNLCYNAKL